MSYSAIVAKIHTRKHPNADRLQIGVVAGHQVITGLNTQNEELGCFFPEGGALSDAYCYNNNEYREGKGKNKDPEKFGYIGEKRRVKAVSLRGVRSEGYWVPLESLAWTGVDLSTLKEGDQFTALNGQEVCEKYITKATREARQKQNQPKQKKLRVEVPHFLKHYDTGKLRYNLHGIPDGALVILTEKLHGTSGRTGHLRVPIPKLLIPWYIRVLTYFYNLFYRLWSPGQVVNEEWVHVSGSRNVTYNPYQDREDGYYNSNFRKQIHNSLNLRKGETIYYEIVGYCGEDTLIMGRHGISGSKSDPDYKYLKKHYGNTMAYTYGAKPGEYKVYVYRITHTNEDGDVVELPWSLVKARCQQLGLEHVPELTQFFYYSSTGIASGKHSVYGPDDLMAKCEELSRGASTLDNTHIREGVVIRVESPALNRAYKYKSYLFCTLEGIAKNSESYVDMEEVS